MTDTIRPGIETDAFDDDYWFAPCPRCDRSAEHGCHEEIIGSVNLYLTISCCHCGFRSGFEWLTP